MSSLRLAILAFLGVQLLLGGGRASAAEDDERAGKARSLYELGMQRFLLAHYDEAIEDWEAGFRTRPAPEFLYNIGQAYRRLHRPDKALPYYQRFLDLSPKAENRAEVERLVASLSAEVQAAAAATTPSPAPPPPPAPAPAPTPAERPLLRKPWFWAAVGGGAALVAAAIVVGVVVPAERRDPAQSLPAVNFALKF